MADPQRREPPHAHRKGLRAVAAFEGAKGLLVLAAGFGALTLVHRDVGEIAGHIIHHLGLDPARHWPGIFLAAADHLTDSRLQMLAAGALGYSSLRLVEAAGLWFERAWAEWLGALSGGIYLPFEIYEIARHITLVRVSLFALNVAMVAYLARLLWLQRRAAPAGENLSR